MKYTIRTDTEDDHELTSSNEIEWVVNRLNSEPHSFIYIEPESAIDRITYMQIAYIQETKGLFKKKIIASYYQVEAQKEMPNGDLYQYFFDTENELSALQIIRDFYENQHSPNLTEWRSELFYKAEK